MGCSNSQKILYIDYYEPPQFKSGLTPIKILFLDVDGVLNGNRQCFKKLEQIITETNCKIVLSSTWRLNKNNRDSLLRMMVQYFNKKYENIKELDKDLFIGDTPDIELNCNETIILNDCKKYKINENIEYERAHEIDIFLRYSDKIINKYNVISWIAIDDSQLNKDKFYCSEIVKNHFVQTNNNLGITDKTVKLAIQLLNQK